jgi:hypothetical protein
MRMKIAVYVLYQSNYRVRHYYHAVIANSIFSALLIGEQYQHLVQCVRLTSCISFSKARKLRLQKRKSRPMTILLFLNMKMLGTIMRTKKKNAQTNVRFAVTSASKTAMQLCFATAENVFTYSASAAQLR